MKREAEELGAEPEYLGEDDFIARLRAELDTMTTTRNRPPRSLNAAPPNLQNMLARRRR